MCLVCNQRDLANSNPENVAKCIFIIQSYNLSMQHAHSVSEPWHHKVSRSCHIPPLWRHHGTTEHTALSRPSCGAPGTPRHVDLHMLHGFIPFHPSLMLFYSKQTQMQTSFCASFSDDVAHSAAWRHAIDVRSLTLQNSEHTLNVLCRGTCALQHHFAIDARRMKYIEILLRCTDIYGQLWTTKACAQPEIM